MLIVVKKIVNELEQWFMIEEKFAGCHGRACDDTARLEQEKRHRDPPQTGTP